MKAELVEISEKDYHENAFSKKPAYSNSIGKLLITKSPLHAFLKHPLLNPDYEEEEKSKFDIGKAAHAMLLTGEDNTTVLEFKNWQTKASKEARDEAYAEGKTPLLVEQHNRVKEMVFKAQMQIETCPDLGGLKLSDGKGEQTILMESGDTLIKTRLDWLSNDRKVILDYKTTEALDPEAWMRQIPYLGYDMQSAIYSKCVEELSGVKPTFVFCIQETSAPHQMYFVSLPPQYIEYGQSRVNRALTIWAECMASGEWRGYDQRIMYPEIKPYVEAEWLEKEAIIDFDEKEVGVGPVAKEEFLFGKVK